MTTVPVADETNGDDNGSKPSQNKLNYYAVAFLLALSLLVYGRSVSFDFVRIDDGIHVFGNTQLAQPYPHNIAYFWNHSYEGLYIPVSYTAYGVICHYAEIPTPDLKVTKTGTLYDPTYFHAANVILHTVCTLLVFLILLRLVGATVPAALGAAIFCIHPFQVESVGWISELRGLLSSVFCLAAMLAAVVALQPNVPRRQQLWLVLAVVLSIVSALAKPNTVVMPLAVFIVAFTIMRVPLKRSLLASAAFVPAAVYLALMAHHIQQAVVAGTHGIAHRFLIVGDAMSFYLVKLIYPWPLILDYGRSPIAMEHQRYFLASWAIAAVVIGLVTALRRCLPWLASSSLLALTFLLPVLGIVPFYFQYYSTVSDRYMYLPLVGVGLAVAFAVQRFGRPAVVAAALFVIGFVAVDLVQLRYWRDDSTLLPRMVQLNQNSYLGQSNLGAYLFEAGRYLEAQPHLEIALREDPGDAFDESELAEIYAAKGDFATALQLAKDAVAKSPGRWEVHKALGDCYFEAGNYQGALVELEAAEDIRPGVLDILMRIAEASARQKQYSNAIAMYRHIIESDAAYQPAYVELGDTYYQTGDYARSAEAYEVALKAGAETPEIDTALANALSKSGNAAGASEYLKRAAALGGTGSNR